MVYLVASNGCAVSAKEYRSRNGVLLAPMSVKKKSLRTLSSMSVSSSRVLKLSILLSTFFWSTWLCAAE